MKLPLCHRCPLHFFISHRVTDCLRSVVALHRGILDDVAKANFCHGAITVLFAVNISTAKAAAGKNCGKDGAEARQLAGVPA
jgi:hypothetical protein